MQPQQGVLQHVVGHLPAAQVGKRPQHLAGQPPEPFDRMGQELTVGSLIAGVGRIQQELQRFVGR